MEISTLETASGCAVFMLQEDSELGGTADKIRIVDPSNSVMLMIEALQQSLPDQSVEPTLEAVRPFAGPLLSAICRQLGLDTDARSWERLCDELGGYEPGEHVRRLGECMPARQHCAAICARTGLPGRLLSCIAIIPTRAGS